ncbi:MAG: TIGR00153 family protein [Deltaproteobacteria bacterium]|nr:TIGR00153 family protein [Deltaproteobacteria bacterium]
MIKKITFWHAKKVYECVELINPVIKAWLREDWDEVERLRNEISRKENEADELKITIRNSLPKSLFYPVPRGDLLRVLNNQDNIADAAEDLCVVLTLRKTKIPESLTADFQKFADQVIDICRKLLRANEELNTLMDVSFTGPATAKVLKIVDEIGKMEWKSDNKSIDLVKKLLAMENQLDPLTIIFIMKIIEVISGLANYAENCGDNLRHLILSRT